MPIDPGPHSGMGRRREPGVVGRAVIDLMLDAVR